MANQPSTISQEYKLEPDNELRFETELKGEAVRLELKSGSAEVFGCELVKGREYVFEKGSKAAVFTWHGATVELKGKPEAAYIAKETPMVIYLNTHAVLEQLRRKAEAENARGPVCMIVGPGDVGKSTLCRMLLNWGVRMGRKPVYVDLDVGQGNISIPGTIGAILVERPALPGEGYNLNAPLVYHYGHVDAGRNVDLFKIVINKLGNVVSQRLENNKRVAQSGMIINTCGWVKGDGYALLTHAAAAFEVDIIVVLDQERLYSELVRDMPHFVKVVFQPKSGGAVERNRTFRISTRETKVREYFYGPKNTLFPQNIQVNFEDVKIFKIGAPRLSASLLPEGMLPDENNTTRLVPVTPGSDLLHHILAISYAESTEEDLLTTNILGFLCVISIDAEKQKMILLSPQASPLPRNILLLSDVQYMDAH